MELDGEYNPLGMQIEGNIKQTYNCAFENLKKASSDSEVLISIGQMFEALGKSHGSVPGYRARVDFSPVPSRKDRLIFHWRLRWPPKVAATFSEFFGKAEARWLFLSFWDREVSGPRIFPILDPALQKGLVHQG